MKFKSTLVLLAVSSAVMFSCKGNSEEQETVSETSQSSSFTENTYAEISVKKGGEWQGKEYVGGTFENVKELTLPEGHTDHSYYIRYEGPGWENAQVGYRLYLDWRNAIDIFGKKTDEMVLPEVGQDGFDSYHEMAPWGMDILKAGQSLGIGSYGRFMNDSVAKFRNVEKTHAQISNSDARSEVKITYTGWKTGEETIDLVSTLSIFPADRFTKVKLEPSTLLEGLTTGIVKFDNIDLVQKQSENGNWGYIATYGAQTLVDEEDQLGMAIFYMVSEVEEVTEGPHDHLVIFKASEEPVTYYLLAAWEQETNGLKTSEAFFADLDSKLQTLEESGRLE
ncbi:MAG TPA: DUF4861 family protein [Gillisia sp.]|nr:DUF4861 family protein [Gillisia sp.]